MLLNIIALMASFSLGFLFFWGSAFRLRSGVGPRFIGHKYLGFRSYADLRSYVVGALALWGPLLGVSSVALVASLGWSESFWVFSFLLGYAWAALRFWKKPKRAWDAEDLPVWRA